MPGRAYATPDGGQTGMSAGDGAGVTGNDVAKALADTAAAVINRQNAVTPDHISPTSDMLGHPDKIVFVGGFFDQLQHGLIWSAAESAKLAFGNDHVQHFTWDDSDGLAAYLRANLDATVIARSLGANTAEILAASGIKMRTSVTLDAAGQNRPNLTSIPQNVGTWLDFYATSGTNSIPDSIAGLGGPQNGASNGIATRTTAVITDHRYIAGDQMMYSLLGIHTRFTQ